MSLVVTGFVSCGWPIVGTNFSEWVQKMLFREEPISGGSKLNVTVQLVPLYILSLNMAAISLASQTSADRFQYPPCDDRVDKIRVDSTWQHVHMQTCCMWDQGSEVDLLVHTKSRQLVYISGNMGQKRTFDTLHQQSKVKLTRRILTLTPTSL